MVKPGQYSEDINHYNVLRTLEAMYGLSYLSNSATVSTITNVWQ
jgi:acid phosphatase